MNDHTRGNWLLVAQATCELAMLLPGRRLWRGRSSITATAGCLIALGLGFGASAAWSLGNSLRLHPTPPAGAVLQTKGPYRLVRHPMYVGMLVASAGWVMLRARGLSIVALGGMIAVLSSKATVEERELLRRFATAYREYMGGTARGLPKTFSILADT